MGSTLEKKRVRLVEDECPKFKDDSRVDNKCKKLLGLVEHGEDDVDVRCHDDDVDPRSKLLLENLGFRCMDYDVDPLNGVDGNSQALVVVPENGVSEQRRSISSEDGDSQSKLCLEGFREDGNMKGLEVVRGNGVPEVIRSCLPRRIKRKCISAHEDEDPQFNLFMENLREDGDSYAFEVVQEDGVSKFIRYHQEGTRRILRRRISDEDVDPQYKLFLENLREDGNSYAFEVVQENGVSDLIRYHNDGLVKRIKRTCVSNEDVDPQYKLFMENLREDGNSYAFEVVRENGVSDLIRYHQDKCLARQVKRRSVCNEELGNLMLVDNCEKALSLVKHGNDEKEHSGNDIRSVDDSSNGHEFSGDDSDIRSMDDGDNGNELSGDDNIDIRSVHDGDKWNEQASDENVHVKSSADHVVDHKSKSVPENLREDANMYAQEVVPETETLEYIRCHQQNRLPDEPTLAANAPMKNSLVKDKTDFENRSPLENLQDLPKRKSSVVQNNAEMAASDPDSGKRPSLEVPNNPEELNSDTPEISESPQMKETLVMEHRVLKLFQKLREKKSSMVKKNAKLEIRNPVSSRTRGHSSGRPHFEAHKPLKEKMETKRTFRRMKKDKVKRNRPNKSAHLKRPKTLRNERSESLQILEDLQEKKSPRLKKNVKVEAKYPCSGRRNGLPNKRPGSRVLQSVNCRCNDSAKIDCNGDDDTKSNQIDESYEDFLISLEMNDESMTYAPQNGRAEIYDVEIKDEIAVSSSDSDVIILERAPGDGCRTPTKKDSDNDLESHTNFREGLMEDLKRPYDAEEHLKLLTDWSNQRPGTSHAKSFRSGVVKQYALKGEYGKPYSVVYKDLDKMITASDRPGSLNLLRGFYYWLKNIAKEGSFKPWTDAECSDVVLL